MAAPVVNLVTGTGPVVGEAIAAHERIDMVSFTGSTRAGVRVAELAAPTVKRVALELGGKSANILLDDLDEAAFERAVTSGVGDCFLNSGQTCSALTRMLVPRERLARAERLAARTAEAFTLGDPFDPATKLGPLVSAAQRDRARHHIERGLAEGARLAAGGSESPDGLTSGYFVRPTVLSDVRPDMVVASGQASGASSDATASRSSSRPSPSSADALGSSPAGHRLGSIVASWASMTFWSQRAMFRCCSRGRFVARAPASAGRCRGVRRRGVGVQRRHRGRRLNNALASDP